MGKFNDVVETHLNKLDGTGEELRNADIEINKDTTDYLNNNLSKI